MSTRNLPSSASAIPSFVEDLLRQMTLAEKAYMMSGHGFFQQLRDSGGRWGSAPYQAGGGCERLGVPALYFTDGPRGVARGRSTCFPVSMARGATFDPDLERRIGEVMGIEARAQGCNLSGAVCINLLRHPAWGRAQETYGEDPFHVGEMGAALAQGIQSHNVIATAKHFALNRWKRALQDRRAHRRSHASRSLSSAFQARLDAGCASVMSSYNKVNGEYAGQNRELLTRILRDEWGFDGFVHSDWVFGVREVYGASAGLDVENPEPMVFGDKLVAAVENKSVEPQVLEVACRRILTTLYHFLCAEDPLESYPESLVASERHRAIALEAARKSAVLLKNDRLLPFTGSDIKRLAVLGRLADLENTGDRGSSQVRPPYAITPLAGLRAALGDRAEIVMGDEADPTAAADAAARCDAAVVVVGYTWKDEGEYIPESGFEGAQENSALGGDRLSLRLKPEQQELISKVIAANPSTVVVVVAGSAVLINPWSEKAAAVLQTFYSGMEGGTALAEILLGKISPSGKLPFTVPGSESDLPFFDRDADEITYGPLHGYTARSRRKRRRTHSASA